MELSLSEKIMYSTLQIEMLDENSALTGYASGFLFDFCKDIENDTFVPALVTNRHVLACCAKVGLLFTRANENNTPATGDTIPVVVSTKDSVLHPDDNIDLAVLPLGGVFQQLHSNKDFPFLARLDVSVIPNEEEWEGFTAAEDVTMVGYPRGLRDTTNNLPIFRRGITATHPRFDYRGEPKFLVDMACFPGSSGSPVFIINEGVSINKRTGSLNLGTASTLLLGIQHAVPNIQELGELQVVQSGQLPLRPAMQLYINLGIIIKSTELRVFESIL